MVYDGEYRSETSHELSKNGLWYTLSDWYMWR